MITIRRECILERAGKIAIWWIGAFAVSQSFSGTLYTYGVPYLSLMIGALVFFWVSAWAAIASPRVHSWMRTNIAALFVGWLAVGVGKLEHSLTMQEQLWWSTGYTITFVIVMLVGYHKLSYLPSD